MKSLAALTFVFWLLGGLLSLSGAPVAAEDSDGDDVSRYAERFIDLFDMDDNRMVDFAEIAAEHERLFGAIDVDEDRVLSVEEFRRRGRLIQRLRTTTLFDLLDVDGDRQLTLEEINAPSRRWFSRYDLNGDGRIDADEIPDRRGRTK